METPSLGLGSGPHRTLRCVRLDVPTLPALCDDPEVAHPIVDGYESGMSESDGSTCDESCPTEAESDDSVSGQDEHQSESEGSSQGFGDAAASCETPWYDASTLPPRDTTGARLQRHGNHWQGWYDRCPRTGKPVGVLGDCCQCPGSSPHASHCVTLGDGVSSDAARDLVMQWVRDQHPIHSPP